jgi:hypothetical protein
MLVPLYGTRVNEISFTPNKKSTAFRVPIFTSLTLAY